jgi:hypothetical protein
MEFKNETYTRTERRTAALWERYVGERQRRLTLPKHRRVGLACHPVSAWIEPFKL